MTYHRSECLESLDWIRRAALVDEHVTADDIRHALRTLEFYDHTHPSWGRFSAQIMAEKNKTRTALVAALNEMEHVA